MSLNGPVAIILAAGQGKRMKSDKAKVLHEVCGRPMIRYVVDAARGAGARTIIVVVGYAADQVLESLGRRARHPLRDPVRAAWHGPCREDLPRAPRRLRGPGSWSWSATSRSWRPEPLADLLARQEHDEAACLLGTAKVHDPMGFGRILRDSAGRFLRIVEERDCTPEEKAIREVNPSCYVFQLPLLWEALEQIGTSNAQHEYYLTDAPSG